MPFKRYSTRQNAECCHMEAFKLIWNSISDPFSKNLELQYSSAWSRNPIYLLTKAGDARKKGWIGTYDFWAGTPWTPLPLNPLPMPPPGLKGTNMLLFQTGIHPHTHQDLKLKCCRVMGRKLRYGRPCTRDLPGIYNRLVQSHIASISSAFHSISCWHNSVSLEELLLHWFDSPRGLYPSARASDF